MIAMLKKEFLCSKFILIICMTILSIFIISCSIFMNTKGTLVISSMVSLMIPLLIENFSSTEEMRKNFDLVMNSFPVKRSDVVYAKFIYYLILYLMTFSIFTVLMLVFNKFNSTDLGQFFLMESVMFMFYSIFMGLRTCLYFACDKSIIMKYGTVLTLSIIYGPMLILALINRLLPDISKKIKLLLSSMSFINKTTIIIFVMSLILYFIFMFIGAMGYNKKDFY
ncbi:ABC-2 family transporter protein [Hathewaya proteolytica DSM 3090]|uniref:ABC-2 family transporter protein n=1 Tax=Hathewaya proteolytica DSM 3090 TaxID=1121331 RepID=A0A1M6S6V3_9CLOT|nr:ABC-2 transporter permease [Hathewaya proteolytica]SHK40410.1 ABC-2 family transporter protein [Hathewaya proteolytica DSM 3090]